MRIAIIGAGNVGQALGQGWTKRGHQVTYGVRNPADAKYRGLATALPADAAANAEAVDARPLCNARLLEPYAMLWIDQARNRGAGRDFAFAVVRRRK